MKRSTPRAIAAAIVFAVAAAASVQAAPNDPAPQAASCPAKIPAGAHCYNGRDSAGAPYWIAIPEHWNRVLVMHAHGGPEIEAPTIARSAEDLERWAVMVKAGYAWAGSAYRRGGYGVTLAAEDVERLRRLFVQRFGQPRRTLLHGQSYGGGVAAKAAEIYGPVQGAPAAYDGVLITRGCSAAASAPTNSGSTCAWCTNTSAPIIRARASLSTLCGRACPPIRR